MLKVPGYIHIQPPFVPPMLGIYEARIGLPVYNRPGPVFHVEISPSTVALARAQERTKREAILHSKELRTRFAYWNGRVRALSRPHYVDRLLQEGARVCYHGATGEDKRFAQWRLCYAESARIALDLLDVAEELLI